MCSGQLLCTDCRMYRLQLGHYAHISVVCCTVSLCACPKQRVQTNKHHCSWLLTSRHPVSWFVHILSVPASRAGHHCFYIIWPDLLPVSIDLPCTFVCAASVAYYQAEVCIQVPVTIKRNIIIIINWSQFFLIVIHYYFFPSMLTVCHCCCTVMCVLCLFVHACVHVCVHACKGWGGDSQGVELKSTHHLLSGKPLSIIQLACPHDLHTT